MRNPLNKRLKRELKNDIGKYAALFLFLVLTIGFISGFLVADNSLTIAYDEGFEKYNIEDGHFSVAKQPNESLLKELEAQENISIYELFYKDLSGENNSTYRVYKERESVNKVCLMEGKNPQSETEIAIDRLYAENNEISINDNITVGSKKYTVSGFVALSDYSALFKNNTDMMFDATNFCVALINNKAFENISNKDEVFCYCWTNNNKNLTDKQHNEKGDDVLKALQNSVMLTDFVKQEDNSAINFTGEDIGADKSIMTSLLYVVIIVIAFVFAVTTKSTIEKEATVIGTLRASGYTKSEILRHYLLLPTLTTLVAAIIGNIIGYTFMKDICAGLYYHSYSLPTYTTVWTPFAFVNTTIIPCVLILIINIVVLISILSISPLKFLRRDLKRNKKTRVKKLPDWKFISRFRARIILQNISAYITMFVGITFASILLVFGMIMSPVLNNFKDEVVASQISKYQYVLKAPCEIDAEKYCVTELLNENGEEITVYGISENSEYVKDVALTDPKNSVAVSNGYAEKYGIKNGDEITLKKEFENKAYTFKVSSKYNYAATLSVFMPREDFNEVFGYEKDNYNGYFSDEKLSIDDAFTATVITQDDLTVLADQLNDSLGSILPLVSVFAVLLYVLLMYLLAKLIVEKNSDAISMVKILGYTDREAGKLYNTATAIVVCVSLVLSIPISATVMKGIYHIFMQGINGWVTFYIAPWILPSLLGIGLVCYFFVQLIQMKKIKKIPMSNALKNME